MNEVFMIFVSLSLSGSLIALLLFLLKPLFKDRLSKTWQYYILLIVILRLLVPFGPEVSLVGIIFNQAGSYAYTENVPAVNLPEINYAPQTLPMETPPKPESNVNTPDYLRSDVQMAIDLVWLGWLVPALILMLRKIIGYHRSVRSVKAGSIKIDNDHVLAVYREVCKAMKIKHSPALAQNESVAAPMLAGAVRPVIILPDICLNDKKLRYVLQHELTHYKRLDIVYKWLAQITVCLHWYNPLVYRICREINRNCELSCDEAVIRRLDENEKYAYGDMLLEIIKLNKISPLPVVSLTLNEDTKLIKERLGAIMKYKNKSTVTAIVSLILTIVLLCGATFTGAYAATNKIIETMSLSYWEAPFRLPHITEYNELLSNYKLQMGSYQLNTDDSYTLTIGWQDGSDTFKIYLVGKDGYQIEYTLSNGEPVNIKVPKSQLYYFEAPRNRKTGNMTSLSYSFSIAGTISNDLTTEVSTKVPENTQNIVYENVEMRRYESENGHPYIHDIKTNNTSKTIVGHQRGMLAYDKDGKPLKIDWNCFDGPDSTFYFLYDWDSNEILSSETRDVFGGWSLNYGGNDPSVNEIAYLKMELFGKTPILINGSIPIKVKQ